MKTRFLALCLAAALLAASALPVRAESEDKPDDAVTLDLMAESWVTTQTARVILNVEAAVSEETSGEMRANMAKAVSGIVKADWRLTGFSRSQDQTGMERWSAQYEARVPESELNDLADKAKKNSKTGMQITVAAIDFTPTLEERQGALSQTREQIYKQAAQQLEILNKAFPGRAYRIANIDFSNGPVFSPPRPAYMKNRAMGEMALAASADMAESGGSAEKSEKIVVSARLTMASSPGAATEIQAPSSKE